MKPIFNEPGAAAAFRSGKLLVVTEGVALPNLCVRCGAPQSELITKRYAWHHPALFLLILLGVLIYVIAAMIIQKKMELKLPLCDEHAGSYRRNRGIAITLLLVAIPAAIVLSIVSPDSVGWWILLCIVMLLAGAVMIGRINPLQPKKITDTHGFFRGASDAFLLNLAEAPAHIKP